MQTFPASTAPFETLSHSVQIITVCPSETQPQLDRPPSDFRPEKYLQTTLQLEHACNLLLDSELFSFHSERMSDLLIADASTDTNPHSQLILHSILLLYGRRHSAFLRSHAKWKNLIPILMDHILVDFDNDTVTSGANIDLGNRNSQAGLGLPIEVRLRYLAVGILYEVCRVQKMDGHDLSEPIHPPSSNTLIIVCIGIFDNRFISYLFDLVEQTRNMDDETLNYSFIKLIARILSLCLLSEAYDCLRLPLTNSLWSRQYLQPAPNKHIHRAHPFQRKRLSTESSRL